MQIYHIAPTVTQRCFRCTKYSHGYVHGNASLMICLTIIVIVITNSLRFVISKAMENQLFCSLFLSLWDIAKTTIFQWYCEHHSTLRWLIGCLPFFVPLWCLWSGHMFRQSCKFYNIFQPRFVPVKLSKVCFSHWMHPQTCASTKWTVIWIFVWSAIFLFLATVINWFAHFFTRSTLMNLSE